MRYTKLLFSLCLPGLIFASISSAQDISFLSKFAYEPARVSEGPKLNGFEPVYPDVARKNGVEGTVKVTATFGQDGRTHNVVILDDLPFGAGEAVRKAVEALVFTPANYEGRPIDLNGVVSFTIAVVFNEFDKTINKVQFAEKPTAEYPPQLRTTARVGDVTVGVIFYADGKIKVVSVQSTMPKEFDEAAKKAAQELKFQPATHKKTKKAVSQSMWVVFKFKP